MDAQSAYLSLIRQSALASKGTQVRFTVCSTGNRHTLDISHTTVAEQFIYILLFVMELVPP